MNKHWLTTILLVVPALAAAVGSARADDTNNFSGSVTAGAQYISVGGDEHKFRQDHWQQDGWSGGVDELTFHQKIGKATQLNFEGRAIFDEDDYKLRLELVTADVGFIRAGFTQFRSYSDDSGGFFRSFAPSSFSLDRDLFLRNGNIFVEAGLTLPNIPKITIGYERQYREGDKSLLEWGAVTQGGNTRNIYPSAKDISEHTDIIKLSAEHDIKNIHLADQFRYERYALDTTRKDAAVNLDAATRRTTTIREDYHHDAFFNTFRMDSHLKETIYWSLGYLFTTLDGDGGINVSTPPPVMTSDRNWASRVINVDTESHVVNFNTMFGPYKGLTLYGGAQFEKTSSSGFTDALLTDGLAPTTANIIHTSNDKSSFEETVGARYTKIPFTTLYAEARFTEQQIDLDEVQTVNTVADLVERSDADVFRQDYRVGFNTSPVPRVTLAGRYRRYVAQNDYDQSVDTVPGYPGFITAQDFTTDEAMAKLSWRPCSQFNVALTYQLVNTDIRTSNEAIPLIVPKGTHQSGAYDANIYSISATVLPLSRWYVTAHFSFQDTRTTSADNGAPEVQTYRGNVYTIMGATGYALDNKTDLTLDYTYSCSDNFKNNSAVGLPLGIDYQSHALMAGISRKLSTNVIVRVRYGFYEYDQPSNGGIDNYTAQLVAANCTVRF